MSQELINHTAIPSRFGELTLLWREDEQGAKVVEILLPRKRTQVPRDARMRSRPPALEHLCLAIERFLDGQLVEFAIDLLDSSQCSPFQWTVLMAEPTIPRGYVSSYSQLASHVGKPRAARAAGTALARNPFPLIVPCHRTVRSDGSLGGYGGGLEMKRALLEMEGVGFDSLGRVRPEFFWDWGAAS